MRKQPREVAVAFAARAALRVLPYVQMGKREGYAGNLVLPVFRATTLAWATSTYQAQAIERGARAAARTADAATRAAYGADAADAHAARADAHAARAAARTAEAADAAAYAAARAARAAARAAFWSAVSVDATRVEEGAAASAVAGSPLWPNGQPDGLRSLWHELKAALLAAGQDWNVWTDWYEDRLEGRVGEEERELAYVRIDNDLWKQGPAIVNAEIKRRIDAAITPVKPSPVSVDAFKCSHQWS